MDSCDHGKIYYTDNNGGITVGIEEESKVEVINNFNLEQNYPNSFNPCTTINYQIPPNGNVNIRIYNMLGKEITVLVNETKKAGSYKVSFDISKEKNISSGIYFARLEFGKFFKIIKLILMK